MDCGLLSGPGRIEQRKGVRLRVRAVLALVTVRENAEKRARVRVCVRVHEKANQRQQRRGQTAVVAVARQEGARQIAILISRLQVLSTHVLQQRLKTQWVWVRVQE